VPVSVWNYKSQNPSIRHMGPMAQDLHAAFGLGESDKGIATIDADGVALAAIQGLNAKLETENAALRAQSAAQEERLRLQDERLREQDARLARLEALLLKGEK
jgi:hypothetical protein